VKPDGRSLFAVVDGKQRLSSLFEFVRGDFPVPDSISNPEYQGKYFGDLPNNAKTAFWRYQFSVEYIPHEDETLINAIFDRINRNVAKLSAQELRHAKLDGIFINEAERLTEWMNEKLPRNFPNIPDRYKRQMKDVEFVSLLLLFVEQGPTSYSQLDLDLEFVKRDDQWEERASVVDAFRRVTEQIALLTESPLGVEIPRSRLRNQADFYSLFGALYELTERATMPAANIASERLLAFLEKVVNQTSWPDNPIAAAYYHAARSASNDPGPPSRSDRHHHGGAPDVTVGRFVMFVSTSLQQRFEAALPHIQGVAGEVRASLLNVLRRKGLCVPIAD
jgi:Protein of unknown function DUF262